MTEDGVTWGFLACVAVAIVTLIPAWGLFAMGAFSPDRAGRWACWGFSLVFVAGAVAVVLAGGGWL